MNDTLTSADCPLISRERTAKLELLLHLIANSVQPLVLCGPKGIGKTQLLEILKERKKNTWRCSTITADISTNLDTILAQIVHSTGTDKTASLRELTNLSGGQGKSVVLIDEAGCLPPGEITRVLEYALANPTLRLVFALTPDELFIKNRTDPIIDDCYFVELPLLTRKQCGDYLQLLAAKPWVRLPINQITEHLVETIYLESQGIPGRIIKQLPHISIAKKHDYALWLLIAAVLALVAIALAVQWLSGSGYF